MRLNFIDLRYTHYQRSTDLTANIVSFGLGFALYAAGEQGICECVND